MPTKTCWFNWSWLIWTAPLNMFSSSTDLSTATTLNSERKRQRGKMKREKNKNKTKIFGEQLNAFQYTHNSPWHKTYVSLRISMLLLFVCLCCFFLLPSFYFVVLFTLKWWVERKVLHTQTLHTAHRLYFVSNRLLAARREQQHFFLDWAAWRWSFKNRLITISDWIIYGWNQAARDWKTKNEHITNERKQKTNEK